MTLLMKQGYWNPIVDGSSHAGNALSCTDWASRGYHLELLEVNELWPEIYNLVLSVMDLTPEHSSRKLATPPLRWARGPPGPGFCVLPFLCSPLRLSPGPVASRAPWGLVGGNSGFHCGPGR